MIALVMALVISSCGGSDSTAGTNDGTTEEPTLNPGEPPPGTPEPGSRVSSGTPSDFGSVAVDQVGFTLYHFDKDKKNSGKSACYGKCEKVWSPYLTLGKPEVMVRAKAPLLGTIKRKDGTTQITYGGWPMYTLEGDPSAGIGGVGREDFGGKWYPVSINGEPVYNAGK
ncbi:MAG TPA: hypothetical protein VF081_08915 [Solirubrobacterales bacterium]